MKLMRYDRAGAARLAVRDGDRAVDLVGTLERENGTSAKDLAICADSIAFIVSGDTGRALAERAVNAARASRGDTIALSELKFCAPLRPEIILCSGENYHDHRAESRGSKAENLSSSSRFRMA